MNINGKYIRIQSKMSSSDTPIFEILMLLIDTDDV